MATTANLTTSMTPNKANVIETAPPGSAPPQTAPPETAPPGSLRPNLMLFHEMKQQFPEIPDEVVTMCLIQNGNDVNMCRHCLSRESQKYLYGQNVDTVEEEFGRMAVGETSGRNRSGSTSSNTSCHSNPGGGAQTDVSSYPTSNSRLTHSQSDTGLQRHVVNIKQPVIIHHADRNRGSPAPMSTSVHYIVSDNRVNTPSPLNFINSGARRMHPEYPNPQTSPDYSQRTQSPSPGVTYRPHPSHVEHSTSSPDVIHTANTQNSPSPSLRKPDITPPPQSAPVMSNSFVPFSPAHGSQAVAYSPQRSGGQTYNLPYVSPDHHDRRPQNFSQPYAVVGSPHSAVSSPGDVSGGLSHSQSPYNSPRQGQGHRPSNQGSSQSSPRYNPAQFTPLSIDVSMGGGNSANAIDPGRVNHILPPHQPQLSVNIDAAQHRNHLNVTPGNSSGAATPVSGSGTPTQTYPQNAVYPQYNMDMSGYPVGSQYPPSAASHSPSLGYVGHRYQVPTIVSDTIPPEDIAYVQALLGHQVSRLERLEQDSSPLASNLQKLQQDVAALETGLTLRQHSNSLDRSQSSSITKDEVLRAREENKRLKFDIQCFTTEVDLANTGALIGHLDQNPQRPERPGQIPERPVRIPQRNPSVTNTQAPPSPPPPLLPRRRPVPLPPVEPSPTSDESEEGPEWNCSACTFLNHPAVNKCEMCEMPRIVVR